mmetsp:Transcript_7949/g.20222  ORF Transcript_7949/g.20222 Transcript_7949/m.20222 type:complete len:521 (-) Transcript_7949:649-2211(-)
MVRQAGQRCNLVGHVGGLAEPVEHILSDLRVLQRAEVAQALILQAAARRGGGVELVWCARRGVVGGQRGGQLRTHARRDLLQHVAAHLVEGDGVAGGARLVQLGLGGQADGARDKGLVGLGILEHSLERLRDAAQQLRCVGGAADTVLQRRAVLGVGGGVIKVEQAELGQPLPGLPAVVGIAVVGKQEDQVVCALPGQFHLDGRTEVAQQARHGRRLHVGEHKGLLGGIEAQHRAGAELLGGAADLQVERHVLAVGAEQSHGDRDEHRLAAGGLLARQAVRLVGGRVGAYDGEGRRAGLAVPLGQVLQWEVVGVSHGGEEVVAGDRLPIVALKVEVHALAEALLAQHGLIQPDHLRTLLIDRDRVEVLHLHVAIGAHGVRHRARVLAELRGAQADDVLDALHRPRVEVRRELLVAEHGEPLLERELEPVAAGHAVASPVVEVLVADDALDAAVVRVGGGGWGRQHQPGVENVERLVLHGAHVEVVHSHNVEEVKVVLEPEDVLVPLHGMLEALHGEGALG